MGFFGSFISNKSILNHMAPLAQYSSHNSIIYYSDRDKITKNL